MAVTNSTKVTGTGNVTRTSASGGSARKAAAPRGTTTSGAQAQGKATQKSLEQQLAVLAEGEVLDPQGLYEFCESLRALCTGAAFFVHAAAGQLDHAVRKGARDNADGRLTMGQKAKLKLVLRRISRQLNSGSAESLLAAATASVKSYGLMEDFLEEIESSSVDRPHRSSRGGFSMSRS
jgi:predicted transglutaminase-like cysteine proteinase